MKRAFLSIVLAVTFLLASTSLFAGPERIDAKDSKVMAESQPVVEKECR
ncbi:MAG: hypothetical protein ABJB69_04435 [Spartobacteria bacterium]